MRKICLTFAGALATAVSVPAFAVPFNTFDPVSMARGGVGVAMPNPRNATLFNPAQLSALSDSDDFAIGLSAGARAYDPEDTIETLNDASDTIDVIDALSTKAENSTATQDDLDELARLARKLDDQSPRRIKTWRTSKQAPAFL